MSELLKLGAVSLAVCALVAGLTLFHSFAVMAVVGWLALVAYGVLRYHLSPPRRWP